MLGEFLVHSEGLFLEIFADWAGGEGEEVDETGYCSLAVGKGYMAFVDAVLLLLAVVETVVVVLDGFTTVTNSCLLTEGELGLPFAEETGTVDTTELVVAVEQEVKEPTEFT